VEKDNNPPTLKPRKELAICHETNHESKQPPNVCETRGTAAACRVLLTQFSSSLNGENCAKCSPNFFFLKI
jgi:hypothetical protein